MERKITKKTVTITEEIVTSNATYSCRTVLVDGVLLAVECDVNDSVVVSAIDAEGVSTPTTEVQKIGKLSYECEMVRVAFPSCEKLPIYMQDFMQIVAEIKTPDIS